MSEYKYAIFFIGSLVCVPLGILLANSNRKIHDFIFILLVFGTCMPESLFGLPTDINFLSREWYRGTTRGIEISYLDLLAIILLFSSIHARRREGKTYYWPPSMVILITYFAWCGMSVLFFSDPKLFGLFELTKILRGILLFISVTVYIRSPRELRVFVWTLAGTMFYEAAICLRDRYIYSYHRIFGTLGHPNSLSMYSLQCIPIFIASFFAKDLSKKLHVVCILAFMAATGCILLSISRTGFAALILISGTAFVLCTGLRLTLRNVSLIVLSCILISLMVAKSYDTIMSRLAGFDFEYEYMTDEGDRGSYFRRAAPALADHPVFGLGLNNWSWWITNKYAQEAGYYYADNQPTTPYPSVNRPPESNGQFPPAHNLYLITVTELGWPGFFIFMALLLHWLWINGSVFLYKREYLVEMYRVGAFLSLGGIMLQSWTEWEFRQTSMFFLSHVIMAVGAALYHHRRKA